MSRRTFSVTIDLISLYSLLPLPMRWRSSAISASRSISASLPMAGSGGGCGLFALFWFGRVQAESPSRTKAEDEPRETSEADLVNRCNRRPPAPHRAPRGPDRARDFAFSRCKTVRRRAVRNPPTCRASMSKRGAEVQINKERYDPDAVGDAVEPGNWNKADDVSHRTRPCDAFF